jgi:hypothetical protein
MIKIPTRHLNFDFYSTFDYLDPNDSFIHVYFPKDLEDKEDGQDYVVSHYGQGGHGLVEEPVYYIEEPDSEDCVYLVPYEDTTPLLDGIESNHTSKWKKELLKRIL